MDKLTQIYILLDTHSPQTIEFLTADATWKLLICIILSSQTTDKQVMKVSEHLFKRFKTIDDFKNASLDDIREEIKSIGFYNAKAKNIKETCKIISEKYNNEVPLDIEKLIELPGVGRKTANCIIGHSTNLGAIIVDTHFRRVVTRLGLTKNKDPEKIEKEFKKLLPPEKQFRFSMTVNLYGRTTCHSQNPECEKCYLREFCIV